uniref:Replication protein A C-terminal domain-containing protein n=1 Tax=Alexandrium catenella TaxID=2925 RepID=A0A7S1LE29_ALECA
MFGTTQVFTSGLTQAERSGPTQELQIKKARQEDKQTCLPVTVRSIELALEQRTDAGGELRFHGSEPSALLLVGLVEQMSRQVASIEFTLGDATGRIRARHYASGRQQTDLDSLEPGRYVSVFGTVRTAPEVHLAVAGMSLVESADEVSYHMIEVAYSAVKLLSGRTDAMLTSPQKLQSTGAEFSPPKTEKPAALAGEGDIQAAAVPKDRLSGSALKKAVLRFIEKEGAGKPEGVAFPTVCGHLDATPADDVSAALEKLVQAGEIYTTIDDGHFQRI